MDKSIGEQWQDLCDEHEAARSAYFAAFSAVNSKFTSIAGERSKQNPMDDELLQFESAWKSWQEVIGRMDDFVKTHA